MSACQAASYVWDTASIIILTLHNVIVYIRRCMNHCCFDSVESYRRSCQCNPAGN
jgi:hypothetical protein